MALFGKDRGSKPDHIGIKDGKLSKCSTKPNCVCSQDSSEGHQIDPIVFQGDLKSAHEKIVQILNQDGQAEIVDNRSDYIHAEFTSKLMRFVDDVEFYFSSDESLIHVRSASRVGHSDMGANRRRLEDIRSKF